MIMPSSSECGSLSISLRFMYAPGSPSSALQMMYFWSALAFRQELPFIAGQESGAAAAAQLRGLDLLDHVLRPAVDQHLVERLVSAHADVFFNVVRIDESAIAQNDLLLAFEERHFVPRAEFRDTRAHT